MKLRRNALSGEWLERRHCLASPAPTMEVFDSIAEVAVLDPAPPSEPRMTASIQLPGDSMMSRPTKIELEVEPGETNSTLKVQVLDVDRPVLVGIVGGESTWTDLMGVARLAVSRGTTQVELRLASDDHEPEPALTVEFDEAGHVAGLMPLTAGTSGMPPMASMAGMTMGLPPGTNSHTSFQATPTAEHTPAILPGYIIGSHSFVGPVGNHAALDMPLSHGSNSDVDGRQHRDSATQSPSETTHTPQLEEGETIPHESTSPRDAETDDSMHEPLPEAESLEEIASEWSGGEIVSTTALVLPSFEAPLPPEPTLVVAGKDVADRTAPVEEVGVQPIAITVVATSAVADPAPGASWKVGAAGVAVVCAGLAYRLERKARDVSRRGRAPTVRSTHGPESGLDVSGQRRTVA